MSVSKLLKVTTWSLGMAYIFATHNSFAKVNMNAMCYMSAKETTAHPFNPTQSEIDNDTILRKNPTKVTEQDLQKKFRIASLSKILTSHWAVTELGPEYRFTTRIIVSPGSKVGVCNIHFEGDMDPFMGRGMLGRIFYQLKSKLAGQHCNFVENLTYDEHFPVFLSVMNHQTDHAMGWEDPSIYFNSKKTKDDFVAFIKNKSGIKTDLNNIGLLKKDDFDQYIQSIPHITYTVQSRPLYVMLKDINKYSFNYSPTIIFEKLGGRLAYAKFIKDRLSLDIDEVEVYNGSGYPSTFNGEKKYNVVTCTALVEIIKDLDQTMIDYKSKNDRQRFQLADIMATGGPNETYSTFQGLYSGGTFNNTLVAKTGSAERAVTFGGMLSTEDSDLYFAVLTSPDNYNRPDLTNSRIFIRSLVQALAERFRLRKFTYKHVGDMRPYDEESVLLNEADPVLPIKLQ